MIAHTITKIFSWMRAEEDCPTICTTDYKPLCGTDNNTYSNQCQLDVHNCLEQLSITVAKYEECWMPIISCSLYHWHNRNSFKNTIFRLNVPHCYGAFDQLLLLEKCALYKWNILLLLLLYYCGNQCFVCVWIDIFLDCMIDYHIMISSVQAINFWVKRHRNSLLISDIRPYI